MRKFKFWQVDAFTNQASKRRGLLSLQLQKDRLNITGETVTIIDGNLKI